MTQMFEQLQSMDRRWLYLAIWIACAIPFLVDVKLPVYEGTETRKLFDAVQNSPKDKVVLIDSAWIAGSQGENKGQVEVVFEHLFRIGAPFVVMSLDVELGPQFADEVLINLVKRKFPNKRYGVDWVNLGYTKGDWQAMQQIAKSVRSQFKKDSRGFSLDDAQNLPLMQRVRDINDISLIYCVTYSPNENWISFIHGVYGTPIAFGCAGIQSTTYYRYILSKQLVGMLVGVRGAAEYDSILHPKSLAARTSQGTKLIVPQAFGHAIIILAVVLGNIGYFASRRRGGEPNV